MSDLLGWIREYTEALPAHLRPALDDARFTAAAQQAKANGWQPARAAAHVAARDYTGARNPQLLGLMRLENGAAHPPAPMPPGELWRANLPAECPHPKSRDLGLQPNQCGACRALAQQRTDTGCPCPSRSDSKSSDATDSPAATADGEPQTLNFT